MYNNSFFGYINNTFYLGGKLMYFMKEVFYIKSKKLNVEIVGIFKPTHTQIKYKNNIILKRLLLKVVFLIFGMERKLGDNCFNLL